MPVPADFASFVANHERRLRAACHEVTGQGQLGDLLAIDLLATIALRWPLWPRRRRQQASTTRLDRLLRRETRAWNHHATREALITPDGRTVRRKKQPGRLRVLVDVPLTTSPFADRAWTRARAMRRSQGLIGIGIVTLLGFVLLVMPRPPTHTAVPDPGPTTVPAGVQVLPRFAELVHLVRRTTRQLPKAIEAAPVSTVDLADSPVRRAVAVLRGIRGPMTVVSDDGSIRTVGESKLAGGQLLPTSLSPDGTRVALVVANGLLVLDVTSGAIRSVPFPATAPTLSWRTNRTALLSSGANTVEVNVDTSTVDTLVGVRGVDLVTARGPADQRLVELVPKSASDTLPPRIRTWRDKGFEDLPIFAPPWIGNWTGPGWSTLDLAVRPCSSGEIALPHSEATAAIGAVNANGLYAGTLVAVDSTALEIIGFLDTGTVLVGAFGAMASDILAWTPGGGSVQLVTTVNGNVRLSVADLLSAGP